MEQHRLNTFSHLGISYRLWLVAPGGTVQQAIVSTVELDEPENDEVYILDRWSFIRHVDISNPEDWEFLITKPNGDPLDEGEELPEGIAFEVGAL